MKFPIIMAAFGTSSSAISTYTHLDQSIRTHFPGKEVLWAYTSKIIAGKLQDRQKGSVLDPEQLLQKLARQGIRRAVVQSLHLFPGTEFHSLHHLTQASPLTCALGMPILTSPRDYNEIGELLRPVITARPKQQILLLGHGTDHPVWTAYYSLEKFLRRKFQRKIHVGVVEKYPQSDHLVDKIAERSGDGVCIIPLFLVTGMHYRRDIVGDSSRSWKSRLEKRGITVETIHYGLGHYPGFEHLVTRHIEEAQKAFPP